MNVVVFSGTTEGRSFSRALAALGAAVTVCVATELGAEEQGRADGITVRTGRLDADGMTALLRGAALCVDATHPYAAEATRNIRAAAAAAGVEYHRLLRPASPLPAGSVVLADAARAAAYLADRPGRVLLLFSAQDVIINKFLLDKKDFAEMDDEEADLLRQRDLQRLQTMERYCQTTECLRNYILAYFGEHPTAPCGNCGSCSNDFDEVDMTDAAKWMINCVAELRGRYGKAILFGTLQGANRARLRELGAERFKSYGRMKDTPRETLERLLAQLLEDGYLVQSDDQYAVLHIGNIAPLKAGGQVLVKLPPQREPEQARAPKPKRRSPMDALTSAGLELFNQLRQLRFDTAQREGLPPYVVFGDKSLVDMCLRAPRRAEDMLGIYGMGERKYEKYGAAFFAVIDAYRADHPDAVLSLDPPAPEPEKPLPSEKKKKPPKAERPAFYLTAEDARSFNYQDSYTGAELKAALIEAAGDPDVKAPTIKEIDEWLLAQRLVGMERLPTKGFYYVPTPAGVDAGLRSEDKVSARGTPYSVLLFTPEAQRMVVEHFIKPEASPSGEAVTEGD